MCRRPTFALVLLAFAVACGGGASQSPPPAKPAEVTPTVAIVRDAALPIKGAPQDYDPLLALARTSRFVMLGESTHGTHEYYRARAHISQRLIAEQGFSAIAVEGDWPDAYRVNAYVRGTGSDATAEQALSSFTRFPEWMWRNEEIYNFYLSRFPAAT